jgi:erythromycin esterase
MLNRRTLLVGGAAIAAIGAAAPFAVTELAKRIPANQPVSENVVAGLKTIATPLATVEPRSGFQDFEFLGAAIGDAQIVSMGEATHGTREFFQLKHRLIEFCVTELGFTVIAFEANYGSVLMVNDYVLGGKGNLDDIVKQGMGLMFWKTQEVAALIEWVRAWNGTHDRKVKFHGFDMQWAAPSAQHAISYLWHAAPDLAKTCESALAPILRDQWFGLDASARKLVLDQVETMIAAFNAERALWIGQTSETEWKLARLAAVTIEQFARLSWESYQTGATWRDRCMADNVRALLELEGPQSKALLWAHNAHVMREPYLPGTLSMGGFLHDIFGAQQIVIGFSFNRGAFRAVGRVRGRIDDHVVGPAPSGFLDAALSRTGLPLLALDLRKVPPQGPDAAWMAGKPRQRCITAVYAPETRWYFPRYWFQLFYFLDYDSIMADPRANYDFLLFVESTTPTRNLRVS